MHTTLERPSLVDRLNDPQTSEVLHRRLDDAQSLDQMLAMAGELPNLLAIAVDFFDTTCRKASQDGIDIEQRATRLVNLLIPVTPPMGAPDFVANSELAGEGGWVDVDKHTLQHTQFAKVFGLGDASRLPTSKTGAAVRKQAPVLVSNLFSLMKQEPLTASYDGCTSCPVITVTTALCWRNSTTAASPPKRFRSIRLRNASVCSC